MLVSDEVAPVNSGDPVQAEEVNVEDPAERSPELGLRETAKSSLTFDMVIQRTGPGDKLGLHLKTRKDTIFVNSVNPGGAADRANKLILSQGSDDYLQPGFMIVRVNNTENDSEAMIKEFKAGLETRLSVRRR